MMSLQVIGAGFGRTGTYSLKLALETLGFGPCYHMVELFKNRDHIVHWNHAQKHQPVDWDALFEGYNSGVDFPVCSYFAQLASHYPEARFVLTVRDVDSWYASASQTILKAKPTFLQTLSILARLPFSQDARNLAKIGMHNHQLVSKLKPDAETAKRAYLAHNQAVREQIPAERLLEFEVKQGWGPLCEFLGVPIPEEEFPRSNLREDFPEFLKNLLW